MKEYLYTIMAIFPAFIITWYSSNLLDDVWEENRLLQEQIWECQDSETGTFRTNVTVTMYHPTRQQTDSTPNIRILGSDYDIPDKRFTGDNLDIDIYYHRRDHDWSTTNLRKRITDEENKKKA